MTAEEKQVERDLWFMSIAQRVASRSKCGSRNIGAVLVQDDVVVVEGYNGSPRGSSLCQNRECYRRAAGFQSGQGMEHCPAVHAETNCVVQAGRLGIATKGGTLYAYCTRPCRWCMGVIINAGIARLVYLGGEPVYDELSGVLLEESGMAVATYPRAQFEE